jgi:hypothetical protein
VDQRRTRKDRTRERIAAIPAPDHDLEFMAALKKGEKGFTGSLKITLDIG